MALEQYSLAGIWRPFDNAQISPKPPKLNLVLDEKLRTEIRLAEQLTWKHLE
jgi:hypothetical protein